MQRSNITSNGPSRLFHWPLRLCSPLATILATYIQSKVDDWSDYLQTHRTSAIETDSNEKDKKACCPLASIRPSFDELEPMLGDFYEYTDDYTKRAKAKNEAYLSPYITIFCFSDLLWAMHRITLCNILHVLIDAILFTLTINPLHTLG
jgi:hypothetical protein